ncbi:MAG TPA: L-rhamnose mutarotase [Puia sp.]|jgi:L-rhamnose mutarotase|nr:L-rhamnose mutarotase [Puia sp.]
MTRIAFTMKLFPGYEAEYRRRHSVIWPDLQSLLKETGIREYSIFLEERSLLLFAYLVVDDPAKLEDLPGHPVMQKWWNYMKDIMESHPDHSPVTTPLQEVFYMP